MSLAGFKMTMVPLSLVCHLFRVICLPYLFRSLSLPCQPHVDRMDRHGTFHWLNAIASGNPQALLVAKCVERCFLTSIPDAHEADRSSSAGKHWSPLPRIVIPTANDLLIALGTFTNLTRHSIYPCLGT